VRVYYAEAVSALLLASSLFFLRRCLRVATLFLLFIVSNNTLNQSFLSPPGLAGKILGKPGDGAVIGLLQFRRKYATGKLIKGQVVRDTFTTLALSGARLIGAGAPGFISFNVTFHHWINSSAFLKVD
jgi:hypothetical protein